MINQNLNSKKPFAEFVEGLSFYSNGQQGGSATAHSDIATVTGTGTGAGSQPPTVHTYGQFNSQNNETFAQSQIEKVKQFLPTFMANFSSASTPDTAIDLNAQPQLHLHNNNKNTLTLNNTATQLVPNLEQNNNENINEDQSLLQKGYALASSGLGALKGSARSAVGGVQQRIEETPTLNPQKLLYFGVLLGVGILFMSLALFFLPLIVFAPQKFALLFTLGSIFIMSSLMTLKGPIQFLKHLTSMERLPSSSAYILSLIFTLYATLIAKSYILVVAFSCAQIVALVVVIASYVPGGSRFLSRVKDLMLMLGKRLLRRGDDSTLPL